MDKKRFFQNLSKTYSILGLIALIFGFVLIMIPTIPYIWYALYPRATEQEIERIYEQIVRTVDQEEIVEVVDEVTLPPIDKSLSENPLVLIERIGVSSPLERGNDYISILTRGSWMVPEFGDPINNDFPIIIAAHRFGYSYWDREERKRISFFNLPNSNIGDKVKIIWEQREFVYEIYKAEESNYITDYSANLILYTCKYFNSPVRIFRYARVVN